MKRRPNEVPPRILAALLIAAAIFGFVQLIDDDRDGHVDRIVIPLPKAPAAPAGDLQAPPAELRDETPADVPTSELQRATDVEEDRAKLLPAPENPLPVGGAQGYSCRNDPAHRGFGHRQPGAKVMSFKLHYTVSPNIPGWGDVDGVGDYLERVGLSAHLIVDFEGHCEQKVPFERNAYTQGPFNSTSESVEIIATGNETRAQWLASPLIKNGILAGIVRDRLRARGLPLRFVDPVGCADRLGYSDHFALECGNNHHDVRANCALASGLLPIGCSGFPFDVFQAQLADGPKPVTPTDRLTCRKLNSWRAAGRPKGGAWERHSIRRRKALTSRHVTCTARGPVRR